MVLKSLRKPPQPPPSFKKSPEVILKETHKLLDSSRQTHDRILQNITRQTATFDNVLVPLAHIENLLNTRLSILDIYEVASPDSDLKSISDQIRTLIKNFIAESSKNQELYGLVNAVLEKKENLDGESRKFLDQIHSAFARNGLNISGEFEQSRLKIIRERINHLRDSFQANRRKENESIWFTRQELDGAPENMISELESGQGENKEKLRIQLSNPDHGHIFSYVKNGDVRKRFDVANSNKCKDNVALLKEVVILRHEAANLLGYPDHATLRLEGRMAKSPRVVNDFLRDLQTRLIINGRNELMKLKALKKADLESRGEIFDNRFYSWDYAFYNRSNVEEQHSIDKLKMAEYFPLESTISGLLQFIETLFGLDFQEMLPSGDVWHEDVQIYSVWNEAENGGDFLGYLYLDIYAREGKDGGAFNLNLQPGFLNSDGTRYCPSTALICSFTKSTATRACLLYHSDVVTLCHELGHSIHNLVSRTIYSRFHGTNTALDFGEAPSQMLEQWCWTPSFLKSLSRHFSSISPEYLESWTERAGGISQPPTHIPDDMIDGLLAARHMKSAIFYLGQVQLSVFDMKIHQLGCEEAIRDLDLTQEYNKLTKDIQLFDIPENSDEWSNFFVNLGHLMSEYDAGYYSYLFSGVYSTDMFYSAFKSDPTNGQQGRRFREIVLEKGSSQDEMKTVTGFLGREPNIEAFYKDLGLN